MRTLFINARGGKSWIGGLYHKRNILFSLLQNERICAEYKFEVFSDRENVRLFGSMGSKVRVQKIRSNPLLSKMDVMTRFFFQNGCAFPFDGNHAMDMARIKPIAWIADFQEIHYPDFFSKDEIDARASRSKRIANSEIDLVLSSKNARNDFLSLYPNYTCKVHTVPFVSYLEDEMSSLTQQDEKTVLDKYGIEEGQFYCVANQFWAHKNHRLVLEAIKLMSDLGCRPAFVFTGSLSDYRSNKFIAEIKEDILSLQGNVRIIVTGFIPRKDQIALIKLSRAVVQPTLFEGWGTVLEDCKSIGTRAFLSDIPVHHEQKRDSDLLFSPCDPNELAKLLIYDLGEEYRRPNPDHVKTRARAELYSREFEDILF